MSLVNLQRHKLAKSIDHYGKTYTFTRQKQNDFGEPEGLPNPVLTIKGLWHESQSYVTLNSQEGSVVRSKPSPQIMVLWEGDFPLEQGDLLEFRGYTYKVTGFHDPTNLGISIDISLEVVLSGNRV